MEASLRHWGDAQMSHYIKRLFFYTTRRPSWQRHAPQSVYRPIDLHVRVNGVRLAKGHLKTTTNFASGKAHRTPY